MYMLYSKNTLQINDINKVVTPSFINSRRCYVHCSHNILIIIITITTTITVAIIVIIKECTLLWLKN